MQINKINKMEELKKELESLKKRIYRLEKEVVQLKAKWNHKNLLRR